MITLYDRFSGGLFPNQAYPGQRYPTSKLVLSDERFASKGLGVLRDFKTNPQITEVINGEYTLEFEYAKDGWLSNELVEENILKANNNGSDQLFRIYYTDKGLNSIKVLAKHIAFDLNDNFLDDIAPTDKNGTDALNWVLERTQYAHGFTGWSDITDLHTARYVRKNMNDVLFYANNSILNTWGGEFKFDNFVVKLYQQRGTNKGLQIRHGKNLTGASVKLDFSTVATRIMPIGFDGLLLPEKYIDSTLINNYRSPLIKKVNFDIGVNEDTTESQAYELMRTEVAKLYAANIDLPTISARIDLVELSKVKEYENYTDLETVELGDTVKVYIKELNVDIDARIVKTTYDCLKERLVNVELGEATQNFVKATSSNEKATNKELDNRVKTNEVIAGINDTSEIITIDADRINLTGVATFMSTDGFVTETDLGSSGTTTIDGGRITSGSIQSSNYVANTTGTKIDLSSGTIDTKNFKVAGTTGNVTIAGDIYMPNGGKVIGADGILTNLQFKSTSTLGRNYDWVGAYPEQDFDGVWSITTEKLSITANIPDNFTIVEAYISYTNVPMLWWIADTPEYSNWGYVRSLKAYKQTEDDIYLVAGYYSEYSEYLVNSAYTEISAAFGSGGYTPTNPSTTVIVETQTSGNIASSLSVGQNLIELRPASVPAAVNTGTEDEKLIANTDNCSKVTSAGFAVLDIIGYYDYQE